MAQKEDNLNVKINRELRLLLEEKGLNVDKIIIFGSYAQGTENVDSDIDLIIVSRNFRDKSIFERVELVGGVGRKLVKNFRKPFDLLFYSDLEWQEGKSPIIDTAKREGAVLHG